MAFAYAAEVGTAAAAMLSLRTRTAIDSTPATVEGFSALQAELDASFGGTTADVGLMVGAAGLRFHAPAAIDGLGAIIGYPAALRIFLKACFGNTSFRSAAVGARAAAGKTGFAFAAIDGCATAIRQRATLRVLLLAGSGNTGIRERRGGIVGGLLTGIMFAGGIEGEGVTVRRFTANQPSRAGNQG